MDCIPEKREKKKRILKEAKQKDKYNNDCKEQFIFRQTFMLVLDSCWMNKASQVV